MKLITALGTIAGDCLFVGMLVLSLHLWNEVKRLDCVVGGGSWVITADYWGLARLRECQNRKPQ